MWRITDRIKWGLVVLSLATISRSLPVRLSDFFGSQANGGSEEYQADVDALRTMTRGMSIPGHLFDESQPRTVWKE